MELEALGQAYERITALGADLIAISPQRRVHSREMKEKHNLPFEVLNDRGNMVAKQFGLVFAFPEDLKQVYLKLGIDVAKHNGEDTWELPMPARYVVDQSKKIRWAAVEPDYTVRPEPDETIAFLKKMK
jgi:peroxiredoxin